MQKLKVKNNILPAIGLVLVLLAACGLALLMPGDVAFAAPEEEQSRELTDEADTTDATDATDTTDATDEDGGYQLGLPTPPEKEVDPTLSSNFYALSTFSTQLPIVRLEINGTALERNGFFISGSVSSYNNADNNADGDAAGNSLQDAASFSRTASIRNMTDRTNSSVAKHDYFLRFSAECDLLPGVSASEYILLGAMNDKSLIRNFLGYSLAERIMDDAPAFELCELFLHTSSGDLYQGVYLLVEMPAKENAVLFYHGASNDGIKIDTYSTTNDPAMGNMYIPFMETLEWKDWYGDVIGQLSHAESLLYASDSQIFFSAMPMFDNTSFVDRFILGELMEDYQGLTEGYYYYDTASGQISVAPIWNFDLALDNHVSDFADFSGMLYGDAFYLNKLLRSARFAELIQDKYLFLRQEELNESALIKLIDEAVASVAPAVVRDWARWDNYSSNPLQPITEVEQEDGTMLEVETFVRQAGTFDEEGVRLKYQLREHSLYTASNITQFDFSEREISQEIVLSSNPLWPIIFLIAFFLLVKFVRRYGI